MGKVCLLQLVLFLTTQEYAMSESFEDTWNKAEKIGTYLQEVDNTFEDVHNIKELVERWSDTLDTSEKNELFGEMLFSLCQIARKVNINSSAILKQVIDEKQATVMDPESKPTPA